MKTDPIFYRLFQATPEVFFELIGISPTQARDYEFRSVEIKQTAFRIDGVFIPITDQQPIRFVETQFQKDPSFYFRLFSEIALYLHQYEPTNDWQAVIIYPSRSTESPEPKAYQDLLASPKVQRLYLNELALTSQSSVGLGIVKLIVESLDKTPSQAKVLIQQVQQSTGDPSRLREIIDLIETVVVYKFPLLSRQELESMLELGDIKQTRVYQEAKQEGLEQGLEQGKKAAKLESIPQLVQMGLSNKQIAKALDLPLAEVRAVTRKT